MALIHKGRVRIARRLLHLVLLATTEVLPPHASTVNRVTFSIRPIYSASHVSFRAFNALKLQRIAPNVPILNFTTLMDQHSETANYAIKHFHTVLNAILPVPPARNATPRQNILTLVNALTAMHLVWSVLPALIVFPVLIIQRFWSMEPLMELSSAKIVQNLCQIATPAFSRMFAWNVKPQVVHFISLILRVLFTLNLAACWTCEQFKLNCKTCGMSTVSGQGPICTQCQDGFYLFNDSCP